MRVIEQTREEKIKMYKKLSKKKLAEMLYECNKVIEHTAENMQSISVSVQLDEVRSLIEGISESYEELLCEAINLYEYYPNNFRQTAERYFKEEIETKGEIEKLRKHFV